MHARARIIAPVLLLAALIGGGLWMRSRADAAAPDGQLRGSGTIEAESVLVTAEISGRVQSLLADEGQEVAKGAPLAQLDTALLEAQRAQAKAALAAAEANLALLQAGARSEDIAAAEAQVAQAKAVRDGAQRALENASAGLADPQDLAVQVAQAQAARDNAAAALRRLRAPARPEDLAAAQATLATAQAGLQSAKDRLSAAKSQAELAMQAAAQTLTQAQARYAQAKYNWEYIRDSDKDPSVPDTNPATGKDYPNNASSGQAERYYAEFVAAEAAMHAAEDQLGAAKVGYDAARAAEATGVQTAEQQVALAQAQLAKLQAGAGRADVQQAETALASAQRTLDTLTGIREKPLGAQSARDAAQAQAAGAEAALAQAQARLDALKAGARPEQLQAAEAQRDQAKAALQQVEVQLGKAQLTAPRAGIVLERPIHEGEQVSPGTSLMTVGSLDTVRLTLYIAESQIGQVKQGQKVAVSVDSFPGRTFAGTVTFIAQEAQFTPRNVQTQAERVTTVFAVRVDLPNPDHALKPGMPADAVIQ